MTVQLNNEEFSLHYLNNSVHIEFVNVSNWEAAGHLATNLGDQSLSNNVKHDDIFENDEP